MDNHFNKKTEVLKKLAEGKKIVIIDPEEVNFLKSTHFFRYPNN